MEASYTQLDILFIIILILNTILSFFAGGVKSVLSLFGWIFASILTLVFNEQAISVFEGIFQPSVANSVVAIIAVFIGFLIAIALVKNILILAMGDFVSGGIDRVLGLAFGFLKGFVIISAFHYLTVKIAGDEPAWLKEGKTYELTSFGSKKIGEFMDNNFDQMLSGFEKFKEENNQTGDKFKTIDELLNNDDSKSKDAPTESLEEKIMKSYSKEVAPTE
jgi:membrane protein required for colicin V production